MTKGNQVEDPSFRNIELKGNPKLVVGWRRWNNRLEARQVNLDEDVFPTLRRVCTQALANLSSMTAVPYGPYAEVEMGEEFLEISAKDVNVSKPGDEFEKKNDQAEGADLLKLVSQIRQLDDVGAETLRATSFSFYGIAFEEPGTTVLFVRKANPRKSLEAGHKYFKYGDKLKRVDQPDLVLDDEIDVVLTTDTAFVLRSSAFRTLTNDVKFATNHVEEHVKNMFEVLKGTLDFDQKSREFLMEAGKGKISIALRIRRVSTSIAALKLDSEKITSALQKHSIDPSILLASDGSLDFDSEGVSIFLDLIEKRLYEGDFDGEHLRADRMRRR